MTKYKCILCGKKHLLTKKSRTGLCDKCKIYTVIVGSKKLIDDNLQKKVSFNLCGSCANLTKGKLYEVVNMKASTMLGGNYLNADKVKTQKLKDKKVTVTEVTIEKMRDGNEKIAVHLKESECPLVLNATNTKILIDAFGDETDTWIKKTFTLRLAKVNFNGEMKDGIQIDAE